MRNVRLRTARLLIRDLPPRAGRITARFHDENRHFHARWEPEHTAEFFTVHEQRRLLRARRRASDALHLWVFELPHTGLWWTVPESPVVGSISLSSIIGGPFQSCFLGYMLDSRFTRRGYMREALGAVITHAFSVIGLHRLEANIMPSNERSLSLAHGLGFTDEGLARRYLKIAGRWEDHLHTVLLSEDWHQPAS